MVDDRPYKSSQNADIGLRILTPWYDVKEDATLRMMSGQGREVIVLLPDDDEFLNEMTMSLRIERFLRKNATSGQLAKYENIKKSKHDEMNERNANARLYLVESLKDARYYVNGDIARLCAKEVSTKMNEAIGRLVQIVFHLSLIHI